MVDLECTDHVVRPCGDTGNNDQADHTRNHAEAIKGRGDGQNPQAYLGLHHENDGSQKAHLELSIRTPGAIGYQGRFVPCAHITIVRAFLRDFAKDGVVRSVLILGDLAVLFL